MAATWRRGVSALACGGLLLSLPLMAADIGGFYADQQKARETAAAKGEDNCPQWIARAAKDDSALASYRAALCYLQADPADAVAAKAWLARSTEQGFMPAQRLLRAMLIAEAGVHAPARHCHPLGDGQQLCHGGAPPLAAAATQ
jgi:TPR repeat protein